MALHNNVGMSQIHAQNETVRRQGPRKWAYPHITPGLVSEVDRVVDSVKTHGKAKYEGRRQFIETAIVNLLKKEQKEVAAQ